MPKFFSLVLFLTVTVLYSDPFPKQVVLDLGGGVTMLMTLCPADTFFMGANQGEDPDFATVANYPRHKVAITKAWYMSMYEVTQQQYEKVTGTNPSGNNTSFVNDPPSFRAPNKPVCNVTRPQAVDFCTRASALTKRTVRLPTEAEWECAARAGTEGKYCFGSTGNLDDYAWYNEGRVSAHPVGQKKPNAWGLYDVNGNLWEWVNDWAEPYSNPPWLITDPTGPVRTGGARTFRGGSTANDASWQTCSIRHVSDDVYTDNWVGFRVAMTAALPSAAGGRPRPALSGGIRGTACHGAAIVHGARLRFVPRAPLDIAGRAVFDHRAADASAGRGVERF